MSEVYSGYLNIDENFELVLLLCSGFTARKTLCTDADLKSTKLGNYVVLPEYVPINN